MRFNYRKIMSGHIAALVLAGSAWLATTLPTDTPVLAAPVGNHTVGGTMSAALSESLSTPKTLTANTNAAQVWARAFSLTNALDENLSVADRKETILPAQKRIDQLAVHKAPFRAQPITCTTHTGETDRTAKGVTPAGSRGAMAKNLAMLVFGLARGGH